MDESRHMDRSFIVLLIYYHLQEAKKERNGKGVSFNAPPLSMQNIDAQMWTLPNSTKCEYHQFMSNRGLIDKTSTCNIHW